MPWRRPGFQLGLDIAAIKAENPQAIGCILGGHGITAWGDTSEECEAQLAVDHRHRRGVHRREHARPSRSARALDGYERAARRRAPGQGGRARADDPRRSPRTDRPMVGHFTDDDVVLDFLAAAEHPRLAELGTSCPDHFLRTKVKPLVLDLPAGASVEEIGRPARASCTRPTATDYQAYYDRNATPDSPGRCAAPTR